MSSPIVQRLSGRARQKIREREERANEKRYPGDSWGGAGGWTAPKVPPIQGSKDGNAFTASHLDQNTSTPVTTLHTLCPANPLHCFCISPSSCACPTFMPHKLSFRLFISPHLISPIRCHGCGCVNATPEKCCHSSEAMIILHKQSLGS